MKEALEKALAGSRKLRLTFRQEAIGDVAYLLGMVKGGIIALSEIEESTLRLVILMKGWKNDRERTVTVTLTPTFDQEWFTSRMNRRAIEKAEAVA